MASTYSHGNFGMELCEALGIPPEKVINVTIVCKAGEIVTANVDFLVTMQSCDEVLTLMKKYQIEKRDE